MLNLVLSLSLSHTGHWKFNMAPHGKELSEDLKKIIVALRKIGVGYKKIAKTLKLSCSTVAKTIQRFNRTGSTQNRPHHGRPKKLSARAQRHIQRLCLENRRMSAASIAAVVEGVGGQPVSAQTIRRTPHQGYNLRSSRYILLNVPLMKTEFGKTAFIYSAPTAWNEIQRSLKLTVFISINEFKLYLNQLFQMFAPVLNF